MTNEEFNTIREQLLDLADDRKSFFNNDGDDDIFRDDYDALIKAVALIDEMEETSTPLPNFSSTVSRQRYQVEITETLQRTINVIADTEEEAIYQVTQRYKASEIILDNSDFINYKVKILNSLDSSDFS